MTEKQKLTLSVEKELVEKAKKLGVNISEVTETVLRHISRTESKEVVTAEDIKEAYRKLFDAMLPTMKKFNTAVDVGILDIYDIDGYLEDTHHVELLPSGEFWIIEMVQTVDFKEIHFKEPEKILSNYIDSLVEISEKNKEELKKLEIFRRIIEALTETTIPEHNKEKKG